MSEKILLAASVALLVCHPRTSINCFTPKQHTNPENQTTNQISDSDHNNPHDLQEQKQSKQKKLQEFFDEADSSTRSKLDIPSPLPVRASKPERAVSVSVSVSVSLLAQGHSLFADVNNSFVQGWDSTLDLNIENIFLVNHGIKARDKFEEYREMVKFNAGKNKGKKKKLMVDGNEFLGFHGTTVTCSFGVNDFSSFCNKKSCGLCRTINNSKKKKKNIWFNDNSRSAHQKLTREWAVNPVKGRKAIVMCRVIAGRIGWYGELGLHANGCDSAIRSLDQHSYTAEELMVLNSRAVLPTFIVIYEIK